jgi:hypothetical protein
VSDGAFALAGTLVGVLATVLVAALNTYKADRKENRELLRSTCAAFITEIMRARQASMTLYDAGSDAGSVNDHLESQLNAALGEAQAQYERLRLTADSIGIQEAARLCNHYAYWLSRVALGLHTDWTEQHDALMKWLKELHIRVRRELGLKHPDQVYSGRSYGLPDPPPAGQALP